MKVRDGTKFTNSHWDSIGKPVLCVDFDHTITTKCLACKDQLANDGLQKGAKEALQQFARHFQIWIYTGDPTLIKEAAGFEQGEKYGRTPAEIESFLDYHGIPYDRIIQRKPPACFIIDDRAVHHTSWERTMNIISERVNRGVQEEHG